MTPEPKRKILVIEDNPDLADLLRLNLEDQQWETRHAADGQEGYDQALQDKQDLIVLDLTLPSMDGMEILKSLRNAGIKTPILILTSKSAEIDRVLGLELGADDYVTKPFSVRELTARIKAIFRRVGTETQAPARKNPQVKAKDLSIDPDTRSVKIRDKAIDLTAREFDLLYYFASRPGRVFTRSQLLEKVWGYQHDGYAHTVNANINRLRAKIEDNPAQPDYILPVWGVGYKFRENG